MVEHGGSSGPLVAIRVIEIASLGPVPFCGQLLSDSGAEVVRIDRPEPLDFLGTNFDVRAISGRGRRSVALDLKTEVGVETLLRLVESADVLIVGFRPGVAERLGFGAETCMERNPRLVYGRCTGWGYDGPLADRAGHDLNFIALAGALSLVGEPGRPPPPLLGLVGDHGGGGMLLAFGVLAALSERTRSCAGQLVDTSIVDGATALTTPYHESKGQGERTDERWTTIADGSAPFYNTYETSDGKYVAVGAIEPVFYRQLLEVTGLGPDGLPDQSDRRSWPDMKERFAERFRTRTRDAWCDLASGRDCCITAVLTLSEAPRDPHHKARHTFVDVDGVVQPAAMPLFGRTPLSAPRRPPRLGEHTETVLFEWGIPQDEIDHLLKLGVAVGIPQE